MSFAGDVKKELSELNNLANKDLVRAELMGYMSTNSSKEFSTGNQYNINRYSKLLNNVGEDDFEINIKGNNFQIKTKSKINIEQEINSDDEIKAFIRGAFLGSGSITNPNNNYHLEIIFEKRDFADLVQDLLMKKEIKSKIISRDNKFLLYIVDGENISRFLALIGANKSVLDFEEARVFKEVRNKVNRIVNCETANLNKTINTSVKQIDAIKLLKARKKYKELSEKEQELADVRLKNPDASLSELAEILGISKSGVNHRMDKIMKAANDL